MSKAMIDLRLRARTYLKYSEDQERDESGRWTSGGGGGGAGEGRVSGAASDSTRRGADLGETRPPKSGEDLDRAKIAELTTRAEERIAEKLSELRGKVVDPEDLGPGTKASGAKAMVASDLTDWTGLREDTTSDLIKGWSATSNDNDYRAMWMQKMAAEEFGVPLSDWQQGKINDMEGRREEIFRLASDEQGERVGFEGTSTLPVTLQTPFEALAEESNPVSVGSIARSSIISNAMRDVTGDQPQETAARSFLRAQYENTQSMFREQGITELVVYRGMEDPGDGAGRGDRVSGADNAMESWSLSLEVAEDFADSAVGRVESMVVPVERVLSTAYSGYGCLREKEVVILGGPGQAVVVDAPDSDEDEFITLFP